MTTFQSDIDHGTNRGYQQHARREVPLCDGCRVAHNVYKAEQLAKARSKRNALVVDRSVHGVRTGRPADGNIHARITAEWDLYQAMMQAGYDWRRPYLEYVASGFIDA